MDIEQETGIQLRVNTMIYVDYNATTPLGTGAKNALVEATEFWGNPSSGHALGRKAQHKIEHARAQLAEINYLSPSSVVFTSGGSEANVNAVLGSAFYTGPGFRLLTSRLEHSSIRDLVPLIERLGGKVEFVSVLPSGELDLASFERLLHDFQPHLVSLMTANNETGVLYPIPEIARLCKNAQVAFHTDAVQAFGKVEPKYWEAADFISLSAHKIHGPKGIGALLVKNQKLIATHYGGAQETKRRGGTENVPGILGFAAACRELPAQETLSKITVLRDGFEQILFKALDGISVQGAKANRICNTSNIRFYGIQSEVLLGALDLEGICVSAGSACSSGSISPSHVLLEMGLTKTEAKECLRFSWGKTSTEEEMQTVAQRVIHHVNRIRERRANDVRA